MSAPAPRFNREVETRALDPWRHLERCLAWQYTPDRVARILAAEDTATTLDIAAWDALGSPKP